jgi:hydroxymethylbilane synthase
MQKIRIATRASQLALWQANFVKESIERRFSDVEVELLEITSRGDKILDRPLALVGGKGHFTKELEDEMLAGNADIAVHSLKDVPSFIPEGLELAAITRREDQRDLFISHKYISLDELPEGAVVGTTSLRRRMQLLHRRGDLDVRDLRGNVNTRLRKLAEGEYDAIILAYIGLKRLNLLKDIPHMEFMEFMIPPMGQGALGIEIVSGNERIREIVMTLDDPDTHLFSELEREFIATIGAGCSAPVAVNARWDSIEGMDRVEFRALIGYPNGKRMMGFSRYAKIGEAKGLGVAVAEDMIRQGAMEILEEAEKMAYKDERPDRL